MCPAFQAELQIIFAGDECRRPRRRQSVKIVCLTIDDLMPLFLLLPVMDLFFLLSLFLALFIFLLKLLMRKRLNSMQQTAQNPMGAKNEKKNTDFDPLFFRKKPWVKCGYVSKSCNAADPPPTKTQQKHELWPILFFSTKRVTCALHSTHHLPTASAAPTPHISHPSRAREDSSPRPQSTVAELPSGTKGWKISIFAHLNTT